LTFHPGIEDVEDFRQSVRPVTAKATDDLEAEAPLTLFPKEGEIRWRESPVFAVPIYEKLLFVAVYLNSDDRLPAVERFSQMKSAQEASDKVVETIVEV